MATNWRKSGRCNEQEVSNLDDVIMAKDTLRIVAPHSISKGFYLGQLAKLHSVSTHVASVILPGLRSRAVVEAASILSQPLNPFIGGRDDPRLDVGLKGLND